MLVIDVYSFLIQGVCITNQIGVWEISIAVMTAIYLLIEAHQALSEVSWEFCLIAT